MTRHKKLILVVDDDRTYADELAEVLETAGYEAVVCCDAEHGSRMAALVQPDLVLLDLKMHPTTGFEMAHQLQRRYDTLRIPLLAMSGHFQQVEHERLLRACGIRDCLRKPFSPPQALAKIGEILQQSAA